jgi:hypothetical protein
MLIQKIALNLNTIGIMEVIIIKIYIDGIFLEDGSFGSVGKVLHVVFGFCLVRSDYTPLLNIYVHAEEGCRVW